MWLPTSVRCIYNDESTLLPDCRPSSRIHQTDLAVKAGFQNVVDFRCSRVRFNAKQRLVTGIKRGLPPDPAMSHFIRILAAYFSIFSTSFMTFFCQ